jgi:hypothetical protein
MKNKLYILLLIIVLLSSCDLLRTLPFEVTSWTPGGGYHNEPENIVLSLNFSLEPDRASVEKNFSLTGDGNRVRGTFLWNENKMTFLPLTPLEINIDYIINLSSEARNTKGLSMDEPFTSEFTTRPDNTRPVLVSCYPEMYSNVNDPETEIRLYFSNPVPLKTLYENVSFSPSMTGFWRLEDNDKLAIFRPAEQWIQNRQYEIRITSLLTDNTGMNIGNEFLSVFTIGADKEVPHLLYAYRITKDGDITELNPDRGFSGAAELPVENHEWEKDDRLFLVFSKPVDRLSLKNYLTVEDAPGLVMDTSSAEIARNYNAEFIFKFDNIPLYESRFTIRVKPGIKDSSGNESKNEYIYRIFANGKKSKPPVLTGLRMPMSPENKDDLQLFSIGTDSVFELIPITDKHYPSGESIPAWIELYFDATQGASINPFSLMELFRIETSNNVITFSPRQIKFSGFSVPQPHPGWEEYVRVEISGNITNSTNLGLVIFQIGAGLKDSFGNKNEKPMRILLIK